VPLVLLERSWGAGFNGIYLVRFGFRMWEILIFKWFLQLKIQINSQKTRFWKEKSVEDLVTLRPTAQATLVQIISRVYVTCLCLGVEKQPMQPMRLLEWEPWIVLKIGSWDFSKNKIKLCNSFIGWLCLGVKKKIVINGIVWIGALNCF